MDMGDDLIIIHQYDTIGGFGQISSDDLVIPIQIKPALVVQAAHEGKGKAIPVAADNAVNVAEQHMPNLVAVAFQQR